MKTILKSDLINKLKNLKGSKFITIKTRTFPRLKAGSPFEGAVKTSTVNGVVNFIYQNSVNAQRTREAKPADFQAKPRQWGQRIIRDDGTVTPLIHHKGKYYLEVQPRKKLEESVMLNGRDVKEDIKPWLPSRSSRQGVHKPIIVSDYNIDNILEISFNGEHYKVQ